MDLVEYIKSSDLKEGDEVWACAYMTNNTEKSMALKQKPVLGVIMEVDRKSSWSTRKRLSFVPYNASGKPIKSKAVLVNSRVYARTEVEAIALYNKAVQRQVDFLQKLMDECKADFI